MSTLKVTFEIADADLEHFRREMRKARDAVRIAEDSEILDAAREGIVELDGGPQIPDFIRVRLDRLTMLVDMVDDDDWALPKTEREKALSALAYFSDPDDLIPDDIPGLGFLDDAIMVELVFRELKHELDAYVDFMAFKDEIAERFADDDAATRQGRIDTRREQLFERMTRRKLREREGGSGEVQPSPLW